MPRLPENVPTCFEALRAYHDSMLRVKDSDDFDSGAEDKSYLVNAATLAHNIVNWALSYDYGAGGYGFWYEKRNE